MEGMCGVGVSGGRGGGKELKSGSVLEHFPRHIPIKHNTGKPANHTRTNERANQNHPNVGSERTNKQGSKPTNKQAHL